MFLLHVIWLHFVLVCFPFREQEAFYNDGNGFEIMEKRLRNASREVMLLYRVNGTTSVPLRRRQHVNDGSSGLKCFLSLLAAHVSHWYTKWLKPWSRRVSGRPGDSPSASFVAPHRKWTLWIKKKQELTFAMTMLYSVSVFPVLTIREKCLKDL